MGYLDNAGLAHLWGKIETALSGKQDLLAGAAGQVVGFDAEGRAEAQPAGGVPSGLIAMWSGASVPAGWALCDGTNGTPDLRGRFVLGQSDAHALGSTGGEETHKLTISEMPKHDHDISCTFESGNDSGGAAMKREYGAWNTSDITEKTGKGTAHNNMPPFYTLAYIMKL